VFLNLLGEFNRGKLDGTETFIRVKRIVIHPRYNGNGLANNIALLELEKPAKLNNHIRMVSSLFCALFDSYRIPTHDNRIMYRFSQG